MNPFWRKQLEPFHRRLASDASLTPDDVRNSLGYDKPPLEPGRSNWQNPKLKRQINYISTRLKRDLRDIDTKAGATCKEDIEHFRMVHVLKREGLLDEYLDFMDQERISSWMESARHFFYMKKLEKFIEISGLKSPLTIVEVGAGSGIFARFLCRRGLVREYIIVDLPEMLLNSFITFQRFVPSFERRLGSDLELMGSVDKPCVWFLEPQEIVGIKDKHCSVALNFNSFMEMDREVRDNYIKEIYRICCKGALFYNVNRRQPTMTLRDGSQFDNHPLLYPYRPSDTVLEWEPDVAQQSMRAHFAYSPHPSFCISRAAIINP